jgi:hypothetical protein
MAHEIEVARLGYEEGREGVALGPVYCNAITGLIVSTPSDYI